MLVLEKKSLDVLINFCFSVYNIVLINLGRCYETKRTCKDKRRFPRSRGESAFCKSSALLPCRSFCCSEICRSEVRWATGPFGSGSCYCRFPWLSGRCFEILSFQFRSRLYDYGQSNLKAGRFIHTIIVAKPFFSLFSVW